MKKRYLCFMALALFMAPCIAQNVAINEDGSSPDPKAILDIKSSNKGVLIPRMSTAQRMSIASPKEGLLVYDSTTSSFWYSKGTYPYWQNLATGSSWSLSGDSVYDAAFLGTTNDAALKILVNNKKSGLIDQSYGNTFWGYQAGSSNIAGSDNTANGHLSLYSNIQGKFNTATGSYALYLSTAWRNTANGYKAQYSNTTGEANTATGFLSLYDNTTGHYNTATGMNSLYYNTTGGYNTAAGSFTLYTNISGDYNTANGYHSLFSNTTGDHNTAIGAGANVTSGTLTNATALGSGALVNASNKVRIGNSSVTVIEGAVPFTTPSDGRFKFQVKEDVKGLNFILQLRPVTYQFDVKRFDAQYSKTDNSNESPNGNYALQASYDEAARIRRSGFIAQEVEKAAIASGYNFSGIIQPKTAQEHYSLSYEAFVVPLVKAVQELSSEVETLKKENKKIADLQQHLDDIKRLLQGAK